VGNGTITMTGAEYDALADRIATLKAENAKLKGEYEWVASINTALDESNQSAWAENAKLRAELERTAAWIEDLPVPTVGAAGQLVRIDKVLAAAPSAPKADDPVKVQLLEALEEILYAEIHSPISMNNAGCIKKMQGIARATIAAARKEESCKR